jgi:hypothetical protein
VPRTLVGGLNLVSDEHGTSAQKSEQAIKPQPSEPLIAWPFRVVDGLMLHLAWKKE